jgi:hypothetical protein
MQANSLLFKLMQLTPKRFGLMKPLQGSAPPPGKEKTAGGPGFATDATGILVLTHNPPSSYTQFAQKPLSRDLDVLKTTHNFLIFYSSPKRSGISWH